LAGGGSASNNEIYNKQSRDDSPSKADGKTKDLVSQVCGAGAQCSDAVLQAAIQAQGANADAASANMQTGAPYVASAAGVALLGPEALMAAALAGGLDYAGSAYSYQTGLSKDKPDFTNSYVAGVIGGAVYPFAIADKVISGMGVAGKIVATGYNAGVAGVGAFGTAGITHQDSPDLSAGVATATTGAAAWAKAVFPSFLGSLANQIIQGAAGPIQNAIQSGTEK
jgi:filamentous hemagglutinin